ncbi:hypothetical protein AC579_3010 [Pseudocercospora musae]|uniref:Uncharacterized protein n=1 Tax=Pseudocercospora musae TaxID=113226 RepID=A0A139GTJ6_9PEZI|nr:hypothetical protein AC579_3010 [Pseudocercospora musae]
MPYISKSLALSALALATLTTATPIDPSTHNLGKRDDWVFGRSKCPDDDGDIYTMDPRTRGESVADTTSMISQWEDRTGMSIFRHASRVVAILQAVFGGKVDATSAGPCYYFSSTKAAPFKDATTDNKKVATEV